MSGSTRRRSVATQSSTLGSPRARKEAGSSGKIRGGFSASIEKVEQFVISHPEESWECHEQMLMQCKTSPVAWLAYRVVNIVSGDLTMQPQKYDMEAWFPGMMNREIVSCSNCLDYQSRSMEIRCGQPSSRARGLHLPARAKRRARTMFTCSIRHSARARD